MKVLTGTVVRGKIEIEGEPLEEGSRVMVLQSESGAGFEVSATDETELLAAIDEVKRGHYVDGGDLLRQLRSRS